MMAFVTKSFRVCDRCGKEEEDKKGDTDNSTGWAELKFTYVPTRWHICPDCIGDFSKFVANEAVLPVKTIKRN